VVTSLRENENAFTLSVVAMYSEWKNT